MAIKLYELDSDLKSLFEISVYRMAIELYELDSREFIIFTFFNTCQ